MKVTITIKNIGEIMLLKGKNAIVTGSNQGFGKAIAEEFIKEGANVVICARNEKLLKETEKELLTKLSENQELYSHILDISKPNSILNFKYFVEHEFETIDILVNNAGIQGYKGLANDMKCFGEWVETININLIGTVNMCLSFIPTFKIQKSGKIINISGGGAANSRKYFSAYATSKAAIVRFSECIAEELKEYNIDVNCIAPGALNTHILDENLAAGAEKVGKEYYEKILKQKEDGGSSMKNAAELVVFLASDKSNKITGRLISAIWDDWRSLLNNIDELRESDIYTLRRILPKDRNKEWGDVE